MSLTVRRAKPSDADRIAEFAMKLVEQHVAYDEERFARIATLEGMAWFYGGQTKVENAAVIVAELGGAVVGFAYLAYEDKNYAELAVSVTSLHDIYVDDAARHSCAGRALMDAAIAAAKEFGSSKLMLHVAVKNVEANEFFKRCGFRPTMTEMTLNLTDN
jgi:GNAT superfamily N-acetyltransferase